MAGVAQELMMNAEKHTSNDSLFAMDWHEYDNRIEISCKDQVGSLQKSKFWNYLSKTVDLGTKDLKLDNKKEGAGIGFLKILHHCHGIFVEVKKNESTSVRCIIETNKIVESPLHQAKTISFKEI